MQQARLKQVRFVFVFLMQGRGGKVVLRPKGKAMVLQPEAKASEASSRAKASEASSRARNAGQLLGTIRKAWNSVRA